MTKTNLKNLLKSTGRTLYIKDEVLESSPDKIEGTFELFSIGKYVSPSELQAEYDKRGLVPADIETMVKHDKELDEKKHVATQWKDADGKWCYAAFSLWRDGRGVSVRRGDRDWNDYWWFAGVRKVTSTSDTLPSSALSSLSLDEAIKVCKKNGYDVIKHM